MEMKIGGVEVRKMPPFRKRLRRCGVRRGKIKQGSFGTRRQVRSMEFVTLNNLALKHQRSIVQGLSFTVAEREPFTHHSSRRQDADHWEGMIREIG